MTGRALLAAAVLVAVGCDGGGEDPDAGARVDAAAPAIDAGAAFDAGAPSDAGASDAGSTPDAGAPLAESEPNGGDPVEEVDALPLGASIEGAVGTPGDADVFEVATTGATLYRATLTVPSGSSLDGHLTILDTGRDGDAAGQDYVKIATTPEGGGVVVDFVAMGDGHYVIVRDARDVGASSPTQGSAGHGYTLRVEAIATSATPISFPSDVTGALASPSGVAVYGFRATEGTDHRFDVQATGAPGTLDLRAYVVAVSTGSWIARNDDRAVGDDDPLIDAPLFASGEMLLVLENPNGDATTLGFTVGASRP